MMRSGGRVNRKKKSLKSFSPPKIGTFGEINAVLTTRQIEQIHKAALTVLRETGIKSPHPDVLDAALKNGCSLDDDNRLLFPTPLVEDIISGAGRDFILHGQIEKNNIELSSGHVHFATGGAAVNILDSQSGKYRPSTLNDLFDIARIVDELDNIQWFARPVVATDILDARALDLNTVYACASGCTKHLGTSISHQEHVTDIIKLLDCLMGKDGYFKKTPFLSVHATTIVSPLTFAEDSSAVAIAAARQGMPILSQTGPQAGATSPAALAGTLVQCVAESLGALVAINLINKGHPVICSGWPFVSDLRTGSFTGGSGEQALLSAGHAQIMRYYDLPTGVPAGMTDSKVLDNQSGYEKALTVMMAAYSGADFVYESAGMTASLMGCSLESFVIDNEMINSIRRTMHGINVDEASLSVEVIDQACRGEGHYLGNNQTLELMGTEFIYPILASRETIDDWQRNGCKDINERAKTKVREILSTSHPSHIKSDQDDMVREKFDILLNKSFVRNENNQGE